jgi:CubicO group peptidase (beta-lactamase class C family)
MPITRNLVAALAAGTLVAGIPAAHTAQAAPPSTDPAAPAAQAQSPKQTSFTAAIKAGRAAVREALKQPHTTSASVAFVHKGKTVWSQTFGRGTTSGKKPTPTQKYGIGSVSKTVTAVAIMQLVDQGKVSLDAPVVQYLPDFAMESPQYRQITVRMLLNHSAGFPGTDYSDGISSEPIAGYPDRVLAGLRNSHLKTTPGAMNVYCNDCFTLAGEVVERVSGMSLPDYVADNIFTPLRMKHSTYPSSIPAPGSYAPDISGGKKQPFEVTNIWASGGLLSTSDDMAQFAKVFTGDGVVNDKRILSSSAIQQMSVDQTATTLRVAAPGGFRYGLGWDSVADPALKSAGGARLDQRRRHRPVPRRVRGGPRSAHGRRGRRRRDRIQFQFRRDDRAHRAAERDGRNRRHQGHAETGRRPARQEQGDAETGQEEDPQDHGRLPGPGHELQGGQGQQIVHHLVRDLERRLGAGTGTTGAAQRRHLLGDHGPIVAAHHARLGPHLPGAAQARRHRHVQLVVDDGSTHPVRVAT